ncbi:uncharacterized protein LOC126092898 [Schistocerca cancellata]|uniref:uncharacterized protein LOC126092898 n=1 Tax=Schistocerca cancellata TaxID=274614 RepID=UPI002117873A|nr:uncharacterized protein LOC126092898 [Schistocerca cancellata]
MDVDVDVDVGTVQDGGSFTMLPYFLSQVFDDADGKRKSLAKKFIEEPPESRAHNIMTVARDGIAVVMNDFALDIISLGKETRLSIQVIEEPLRTIYTSFVVPRRSPFVDAINIATLRLTQFGILPDPKIYFKTILEHNPSAINHLRKPLFQDTTARSFNINDLKTVLYVLAFCLSLASLVLILELLSVKHFWQIMTRRIRF